MNDYQLIVIGAGPGGYTAALRAAKLGLKTAVVERREAGGTCLNRGCVPTKALLHASQLYKEAQNGASIGINAQPSFDLARIFERKAEVTGQMSKGIESLFKSAKVTLVRGTGKIMGEGRVCVTAQDGSASEITADDILIATGSVPAMPPIPGLDLPGVLTSDTLLEGSDKLYESLVIIGGGVIGVELATFYAELGTKVIIVEGLDRLLPNMDRELGQNLAMNLKKMGVEIHTKAMVKRVEESEGAMTVVFASGDSEESVSGEKVLCAIGRSPYSAGLFAEGLQPEMNRRSIKVDDRFATSIPHVYAIGDVSSRIQLAHVAAAQGTACVEMIAGAEPTVDLSIVPSCIYTHPEIASVGMTDAEAKEAGIAAKTGKCVMGGNARTVIAEAGRCFMKVVANAETGALIGAQLMCPNATDMISQLAQAIANRMSPADLLKAMRPHPTFEEALGEALEDLCAKLAK
ncbi:MAG: dihydrolipoyl dehydrogenase [Firmicutes bacterium]|nr:dihydrolipoyl dehydrogenase [Bacillota bacterium]MBQ6261799.1 dihydrolipoyl dehydrogenase [Bacillota bacterium]